MNKYIGNKMQLYSVCEVMLLNGKGKGTKLIEVKNASGLSFKINADRCADITELSVDGVNYSYISPVGYVAPSYYDKDGINFLKSFTGGFFTTCGLTNVGSPCVDEGETFGLHGSISNTPCENIYHYIKDDKIYVKAEIKDARLFSYQLVLEREYEIGLYENKIKLTDKVKNIGNSECVLQIMYHCNMGYPLLCEDSILEIPSTSVIGRDEHAKNNIDTWNKIEKPQIGYQEMCFFHKLEGETSVSLYNPNIKKGVKINYNADNLKHFTEWKMMGEYDYALGLEPGNTNPSGRDEIRAQGLLETIVSDCESQFKIEFEFIS